jgi:hypothetical protein
MLILTTCRGNCTSGLWPGYREDWAKVGVKAILGFNEPDNAEQSNLTPEQASVYWGQLDDVAQSFNPPLILVGPGMTHWDETGGSPWLDQFFGNLSDSRKANIKFLGQHDYSGNPTGIIAKAEAAYKKYGRKVWLTEFSVGSGKGRSANDAFMEQILPLLDASEAVDRYAWYSTRNAPASWVNESFLLPPIDGPGWRKQSGHSCGAGQMKWLSQHGTVEECQEKTVDDTGCAEPKRAIYQSGDVKNCYCANTSTCTVSSVSCQDLYEYHGVIPVWAKTSNMACKQDEMLWLSQHKTLGGCEADAKSNGACASSNKTTKTVIYQTGDVKNCYCLNTSSCTQTPSTWQDIHFQPTVKPFSMVLSSTGRLYTPVGERKGGQPKEGLQGGQKQAVPS